MSKLSIPIKAFQFPKTCKKPLQDLEESPLKKKKTTLPTLQSRAISKKHSHQ